MKKIISLLLVPLCLLFCAVGCGKNDEKTKEGNFYTVTEAYEKGYLTREQVMSIAYYHNGGRSHNEEIMNEDYQPLPKLPEKLSEESEKIIKQSYFDRHWKDRDMNYLEELLGKKLEISIEEYDGTYGSCVAVMMSDNYSGTTGEVLAEEVVDIKIYYISGNRINIWMDAGK